MLSGFDMRTDGSGHSTENKHSTEEQALHRRTSCMTRIRSGSRMKSMQVTRQPLSTKKLFTHMDREERGESSKLSIFGEGAESSRNRHVCSINRTHLLVTRSERGSWHRDSSPERSDATRAGAKLAWHRYERSDRTEKRNDSLIPKNQLCLTSSSERQPGLDAAAHIHSSRANPARAEAKGVGGWGCFEL